MNKNVLIDRNQVLTIMTEALVMKEASAGNSPWLVQLHYAWNDPLYLYLAMDFCVGGDLRCVLENVELDEKTVQVQRRNVFLFYIHFFLIIFFFLSFLLRK